MEVRVSCVPTPGAEPQGIRVRISEPKKGPATCASPPNRDSARIRCPSMSEKDFYRKTASLDRRERFLTLSGAEIKRGLVSTGADAQRRKNPMLDRKSRSEARGVRRHPPPGSIETCVEAILWNWDLQLSGDIRRVFGVVLLALYGPA